MEDSRSQMKACAFPRADRTESQGPWAGGTKGADQWRTEVRITAACQAGAEVTTDRDRVWGGGPGEETYWFLRVPTPWSPMGTTVEDLRKTRKPAFQESGTCYTEQRRQKKMRNTSEGKRLRSI